jgi:hypothetical protein
VKCQVPSESTRILIKICRFVTDQVEEGEMGGPCSTNGEEDEAYRLLVGKPEGKNH